MKQERCSREPYFINEKKKKILCKPQWPHIKYCFIIDTEELSKDLIPQFLV